jgi:hypothetical protein
MAEWDEQMEFQYSQVKMLLKEFLVLVPVFEE